MENITSIQTLTDNLVNLGLIDKDNFHDCEEMDDWCARCAQYENCSQASQELFNLITTKTIDE